MSVVIKRKIVKAASELVRKIDIGVEDIIAVTQPLAELVTSETGIEVYIVMKDKTTHKTLAI